jgi:hypothetical protein
MQKKPSIRFREFLLTKTKISKIVELSSVRKLVFKNAQAPAVILSYSFSEDEPLENRFEYVSMKPNLFFRLFNIIVVEKPDIKYVPQRLLLENDWAWKTQVELIQESFKQGNFSVARDVSGEIEKLNEMILEAFNLADNAFVDYALNVQIPLLAGAKDCKVFRVVNSQDLSNYTRPFVEALSAIFGVSGKFISVNIYPAVSKYYSAIEVVVHDSKPISETQIIDDPTSLQVALTKFSPHKINDMFFELKDVIHFGDNSFYIIKSNHYKNWHPAIAQLDLAEVVHQILSRNGENN